MRSQCHGDFEVGRRSFTINSFIAKPLTASAKSPQACTILSPPLSVGGTLDIFDDAYHQHTTNRWGPVASMGFSDMTIVGHDEYQFEPLAQVSFEFKAAIISSPILQAKGLEGESKASRSISIQSSSWYYTADHAPLLHAKIQAPVHNAIHKSTALDTFAYEGMVQCNQRAYDTSANARMCRHLCSQVEVFDFRVSRD